jgi:hypothetical protein
MIGEEELYRSCKEGVCIGDLAKKTNANYGARCDAIRLDDGLVLTFETYSVNEEAIFETFTDYDVNDFRGMLASLEARLPGTFQKIVSASERAAAAAKDKAREQQKQETTPAPEPAAAPEPPPAAVIQQPALRAQEVPLRTTDFTAGERWGTWVLNIIPGLGSYIIMDDKKGATANLAIGGSGLALAAIAGGSGPLAAVGGMLWIIGGSAWNTYRSAAYHPPGYHPTPKPKKPKKPVSYGAGGVFAHNVGGGVEFDRGGEIAMPYSAGGAYFYFDLVYIEFAAGFAGGSGKWKSFDTNYPEYLPDMPRTYVDFGALLKLPFGWERVKLFPLVGIDYEQSISAELKNGLSSVRQPSGGDLSALWFKFGAGLNINLWQNAYLRTEALYGRRTENAYERYYYDNYDGYDYQNDIGYVYTRMGDGWTLKIGIGLNIVRRQPDAENGNKHKNTNAAASGKTEEK